VLQEVRPQLVITFGPDGLTAHHDHVRTGEATDEAFRRTRDGTDRPSDRLLHVAVPRSAVVRFDEELASIGDPERVERSLLALQGVPDEGIAVAVDTRPVMATKLAGIEAHRTQIGELERIPERLRWVVLETEWFVQAWPADRDPAGPSGDLLAEMSTA
jgi:N-acetyl-1-D-myo-inositol-2-amino-2-deoxy-alpha-D-glucopyranoside deacetylase